jgi:hypothetical protein
VGPRTGLENMKKKKFLPLPGLELRLFGRPARRQSLYRLLLVVILVVVVVVVVVVAAMGTTVGGTEEIQFFLYRNIT